MLEIECHNATIHQLWCRSQGCRKLRGVMLISWPRMGFPCNLEMNVPIKWKGSFLMIKNQCDKRRMPKAVMIAAKSGYLLRSCSKHVVLLSGNERTQSKALHAKGSEMYPTIHGNMIAIIAVEQHTNRELLIKEKSWMAQRRVREAYK